MKMKFVPQHEDPVIIGKCLCSIQELPLTDMENSKEEVAITV
jgi:hypothetical protein